MKISDRQLDRMRLGEVDDEEARAAMSELQAAGEVGRLDRLIESADAYEQAFPAHIEVQRIREAARRAARQQPAPERNMSIYRQVFAAACVLSVAGAVAITSMSGAEKPEADAPAPAALVSTTPSPAAAATSPKVTLAALLQEGERLQGIGKSTEAASVYERMVTMDASSDPDSFLQARVRIGLYQEALGESESAHATFQRTVAEYAELARGRELTMGADAAAEAQFMISDSAATAMVSASLVGSDAELRLLLEEKLKAGQAAQAELQKVVDYGRPRWSVAAYYRLGVLYQDFARSIRASAVPAGQSAEQREAYRTVLDKNAGQVDARAEAVFSEAVKIAKDAAITTTHSTQARLALKQLESAKSQAPANEDERVERPPSPTVATEPPRSESEADSLYSASMKALLGGRYAAAIDIGEKAIAGGCTNKCYRVVGIAHHKLGHSGEACSYLQKAGSALPKGLSCP